MEAKLHTLYTDPKTGYRGEEAFIKLAQKSLNLRRTDIKKWLNQQDTITSLRKTRKSKLPKPRVIVGEKLQQWDLDNAVLKSYAKENDGYGFFLLAIDDFSKFVYTRPLKTLTAKEVLDNLKDIFSKEKPMRIRTDAGSEFKNRWVKSYLKEQDIEHWTTTNETKANIAERAIKTIKMKLTRYMLQHQSHRWVDVLQDLTDNYNSSDHSTIEMTPDEAKKADDGQLWENIYEPDPPKDKKPPKISKKKSGFEGIKYQYKIGQQVKISHLAKTFGREYDQKFTNEVFTVANRYNNQGRNLYELKDFDEDLIDGRFYADELTKVNVDENTVYKIDKIIKKKGAQVFVSWLGWPKKFNSWISKESVKDYKG